MLSILLLISTVFSQNNCPSEFSFTLPYGGIQLYDCNRNDWDGLLLKTNVTGTLYQKLSTYSRSSRTSYYARDIGIIGQSYKLIQDAMDEINIRFSRRSTKYGRGQDQRYLLEYNCQSVLCKVDVKTQEGSAIQIICFWINVTLAIITLIILY